MKRFANLRWLATVASAAVLLCVGFGANAADPLKVAFVYLGPIGDGGWTYQHDQGRLALEKALGSKSRRPTWRMYPRPPTPNACCASSQPTATS